MKSSRKKTFTAETDQEASRYCINSNELSNCWVISKRILLVLCWGLETSPFPDEARFSGWGPRVGRGGGGIRLNLARRRRAAFPIHSHTHTHRSNWLRGESHSRAGQHLPLLRSATSHPAMPSQPSRTLFSSRMFHSQRKEGAGGVKASQRRIAAHRVSEEEKRKREKHG